MQVCHDSTLMARMTKSDLAILIVCTQVSELAEWHGKRAAKVWQIDGQWHRLAVIFWTAMTMAGYCGICLAFVQLIIDPILWCCCCHVSQWSDEHALIDGIHGRIM